MFEISTNVPKIIIIPIHPTQTAILTHGSKRHQLTPAKRHQRLSHNKQISPVTIPLRDGFKAQYHINQPIPITTSNPALEAGATTKSS